jgi:hypothetical protein
MFRKRPDWMGYLLCFQRNELKVDWKHLVKELNKLSVLISNAGLEKEL